MTLKAAPLDTPSLATNSVDLVPPAAPAPISAGSASNLDSVWAAVLAQIIGRNALSWLRWLRLTQLDEQVAHLSPLPGRRDVLKFLTDRQKDQLTELLATIVGRRLRVELEADSTGTDSDSATGSADFLSAQMTADDQRKAMGHPLVQQILQQFDADIIAVHHHEAGTIGEKTSPRH